MIKSQIKAALLSAATIALTGCVDDNYDLSNVDTTTRINVNDLVLPVNIDPIRLGDVITFDENSKIQPVTMGGKEFYALVQGGEFSSETISITDVRATPTPINPTRETLRRLVAPEPGATRAAAVEFRYPIVEIGNDFSYRSFNIDEAIVSLDRITTAPFEFKLNLQIEDPHHAIGGMTFIDLVIRAPKGLTATPSTGTYDPATGLWLIPRVDVVGNHADISLRATGVDMVTAGVSILPDRSLDFNSEFRIQTGYVDIEPLRPDFPDEVMLVISYGLSDFEVRSFDGQIQYTLDGIDIAPVTLTDIPDFLAGDETDIHIANPQIYLQINNPVAGVPLDLRSGMTLTACRDGEPDLPFSLDAPIDILSRKAADGLYNFVLSPSDKDLNLPDKFAQGLEWHRFSTLGSLLATPASWTRKGLPDRIEITLPGAGVPQQRVTGFTLPRTFESAHGEYELIAPLALNDGSKVIYTEVRDGWSDDDLDHLTVTTLKLTAHAVNNCPVGLQLTVYPIDTDGNTIDAKVESNRLEPNSETELTIELTGEVHHLDGIRLVAVLEGGTDDTPLSPEQTLTLTDIRARVSGYYEKEF